MKPDTRVLLVDDEPETLHSLVDGLHDRGFDCSIARGGGEAITRLEESDGNVDVVVTDVRMHGMDGLDLTQAVTQRWSNVGVIIMTAYPTTQNALIGGRHGAAGFVAKPVRADDLGVLIRDVCTRKPGAVAARPAAVHAPENSELPFIVGRHRSMQELRRRIRRLADQRETVLIHGESGTGKELVARGLHLSSSRRNEPFLAINCGAIPAALLESELFGYVRGAFSGADSNRSGYFVDARNGTLLLDEIGEMPYVLQVKLLRALEEREVTPLGTTKSRSWSARVICATNRNLAQNIAGGKFREDLYYRINVLGIHVPPLRERRSDIAILARHFVDELPGASSFDFSIAALAALQAFEWPGNVRQLRSVLVGAVANCSGRVIRSADLPPELRAIRSIEKLPTYDAALRDLVIRALRSAGGTKTYAAELLEIDRNRLARWIDKFGIRPDEYQTG